MSRSFAYVNIPFEEERVASEDGSYLLTANDKCNNSNGSRDNNNNNAPRRERTPPPPSPTVDKE